MFLNGLFKLCVYKYIMVIPAANDKTHKLRNNLVIFIAGMVVMLLIFMASGYIAAEAGINLCSEVCGILS